MYRYSNPVVRGVAADPSVVRVGEDYFLATSTFDLWPGIVIRHSTDLKNWRIIGAAVTRPAQYRRDGLPGELLLYAPTLRHHDGVFYLICTNVAEGQGNFVVRTDDPAGKWSDALWLDTEAFDPSLLWDDGTWYYTRRTLNLRPDGQIGPVVQAELDIDTGALGELRELTPNWGGFCSNDIEGPHLFRIGDWYYLFSAEGSTWKGHMQTVARSRSPWGPFEPAPHNPVITHRHRVGHPIQTLGHADLVEDADGNWWAVALGTRHANWAYHHNLGRETFLLPVEWVDGWPHIGVHGTTELSVDIDRPLSPSLRGNSRFDAVADTLWTRGWQTVGLPDERLDAASVTAISLPAGRDPRQRGADWAFGTLLLAQTEDEQVFEATVAAGEVRAGIGVYSDARHCYALTCSEEGVVFERTVDDLTTREIVAESRAVPVARARMRIEATAERYRFLLEESDAAMVVVGEGSARLLSAETAERFIGVHFVLLAVGADGAARFTDVSVDGRPASR